MKKLDYSYVKEYVEKYGYILVDKEYTGIKNKLTLIDKEGYYYYTNFDTFNQCKIPEKFHTYNPYTINNIKLWCNLNNKPFELISNTYNGSIKHLKWKCLIDNCCEFFNMSWSKIHFGARCPYCTGQKVGLSNCLATSNPTLASEWHSTLNGDLTPNDVTFRSGKKVWWKCKECGYNWITSVDARHTSGCPDCNKSKGENKISDYFKNIDEVYQSQKTYYGLIGLGNGNLSYDFYLPQYNLLIEYQGIQHERFCKGVHKFKNDFEKQQKHDLRKREYAKNNNIKLLEIWYWDFDNIEEILNKELNKK